MDLYEEGKGSRREAPGLNVLHKLTNDHIHLTPYTKMKVNLAVQVRICRNSVFVLSVNILWFQFLGSQQVGSRCTTIMWSHRSEGNGEVCTDDESLL